MKLVSAFLSLLIITGNSFLYAQAPPEKGKAYENVLYKKGESGDSLMLDIFMPGQTTPAHAAPVVMIIHGGGWAKGERTLETIYYMQQLKRQLNNNGFAVVSIDYTLVSKDAHFPDPVADCKDAVRWIRANASRYNFDADNIGLWGGSAGGHLALLTAYTGDEKWKGDSLLAPFSSRVNYVVDNFGPTDLNGVFLSCAGKFTLFFAKLFFKKLLFVRERLILAITDYSIQSDKEKAIETLCIYSPILYVNASAVPTIIFHGTKDKVVPIEQSKKLQKLLADNNVENEFMIVEKGDHGFNNISREETDTLVNKTVDYIIRHTKR
ncbi:MAG: alpha/beta hydrolase [Sphingobacteriales bacterium]|nr:alpha/beta hydrolase [Sphingobacteriales bacterium]